MRAIAILTFVVLPGAMLSACCDCARMVTDKEHQISELEAQVAELATKAAELERAAAQPPAEGAVESAPPAEGAPEDLASCIERLKACELDPFKGGKYFTLEKVDPQAAGKASAEPTKGKSAELVDPFRPRPEPAKGEVTDPFAKKK